MNARVLPLVWLLGRYSGGSMMRHDPVMLAEVLDALALRPGGIVVDGTLGLAGHALRFAQAVGSGGAVVGMDWDETMLAEAKRRLEQAGADAILIHDDYRAMPEHLSDRGIRPDGVLLDLGLNSAQIEDPERGIAFLTDGPLDMRMDRSRGEPASALLNRLSADEIERVLFEYGDERWARAIAKKIVEQRRERPLRTTADLVEAVLAAIPKGARDKRIHPATRTFQAVRIAVNDELEGLDEAFLEIARSLAVGGTLVVLSYHSGEDRQAKRAFRELAQTGEYEELTRKPVTASAEEIAANPRSRSAKMRAIRRLA
jgi:16S rRNA (cytosine1402-N4)-methyltransferase